jgi:hypothetical protein
VNAWVGVVFGGGQDGGAGGGGSKHPRLRCISPKETTLPACARAWEVLRWKWWCLVIWQGCLTMSKRGAGSISSVLQGAPEDVLMVSFQRPQGTVPAEAGAV